MSNLITDNVVYIIELKFAQLKQIVLMRNDFS